MYWLLLPPDANTQRHLDMRSTALDFAPKRFFEALRGAVAVLRRLVR